MHHPLWCLYLPTAETRRSVGVGDWLVKCLCKSSAACNLSDNVWGRGGGGDGDLRWGISFDINGEGEHGISGEGGVPERDIKADMRRLGGERLNIAENQTNTTQATITSSKLKHVRGVKLMIWYKVNPTYMHFTQLNLSEISYLYIETRTT